MQLVLEVVKTVVHRGGRQHQDFCPYACADNAVHQLQIAVLTRIVVILVCRHLTTVAEVMAFVYHHKVVVSPVDIGKFLTVCLAFPARKVAVKEHIIAQAVFGYRIILVITLVGNPVVIKFLRTKHKHRLVSVLVVFDDR